MTILDTSPREAGIGNHIHIQQNPENPCQVIASLDFPEEAVLSYADVCTLLVEVRTARRLIEWAMTDYATVREFLGKKRHITLKDTPGITLCKRSCENWDKDPLLGTPSLELFCKRCIRVYEADVQHPDMEETLEPQVVQFEDFSGNNRKASLPANSRVNRES